MPRKWVLCPVCGSKEKYKSGRCRPCAIARESARYASDPEAARQRRKDNYVRNKSLWKDRARLKLYGITPEQFSALWLKQAGACPGCSEELTADHRTHVDHDHGTGRVRGLLCSRCNTVLGMALDKVETLLQLGVYLERSHGAR